VGVSMSDSHKNDSRLIIYKPKIGFDGFFTTIATAGRELFAARFIIWKIFWRDFVAQFRQKMLGYVWIFLSPLFGIVGFLILYYAGVLVPGESGVPYPLYMFLGTSIWSVLPMAMNSVSVGLQGQADLIMRTNIPKIALAMSALANTLYNISINIVIIIPVMLLFGVLPNLWMPVYPLLLLPLLIIGIGMGLILSVLGVIARDILGIVNQALAVLMFMTPVIFVTDQINNPLLKKIITLNPLTYLIELPRSMVTLGSSPYWLEYSLISLFSLIFLCLSVWIFYTLHDLVAERL
jgi:lipopolysaccharide transport system permease protein